MNALKMRVAEVSMRDRIVRAMMSEVFLRAQPDRGDVFSWLDDHSNEIADAVLSALGEPTEAMIDAAKKSTYVYTAEATIRTLWKAMIDAAQTPAPKDEQPRPERPD